MRWFVEVASSQTEPPERWVVEATQWQPALQAARTLRGEAVEMSGFSIELLEDGFRAVDPTTFVRYVVRRAPDGTPVSSPRSKPPPAQQNGGASAPPAPGSDEAGTKAARIAAMLDLGAGAQPSKPPVSMSSKPEPMSAKAEVGSKKADSGSKKSDSKSD